MITDVTFQFSKAQDLSSVISPSASPLSYGLAGDKVVLSTNYYNARNLSDTGGRVQYVHVHVDTAITSSLNYVSLALLLWPDDKTPSLANYQAGDPHVLIELPVEKALLVAKSDWYLPLPVSSLDALPTDDWKWLNFAVAFGTTSTGHGGKVTTSLTDAITNDPRIFSAKNST